MDDCGQSGMFPLLAQANDFFVDVGLTLTLSLIFLHQRTLDSKLSRL
jgi:hypothetical protein